MMGRCFLFGLLRTCMTGLMVGWLGLAWAQPLQGQPAPDVSQGAYAVSLEQYNRYAQWKLRGVDGRDGITFGIREDERIRNLQLDLAYGYSPALLEDLSHLNVLLNGEVVASLPMSKQQAESTQRAQISLPTARLRPYNYLELQAISHYTMGCEDPLHPDLWVNIDKSSRLVFDTQKRVLPNDLALLPTPFFDPRDVRALELPFVLGEPSDTRLEAAGVVASWLGALTGYRGARFTAVADAIPQNGNAIVVLGANDSHAGLSLPAPTGPIVAVHANPNDPAGKLLVITGRNDEEIRNAAVSLALGAQTLSGPSAILKQTMAQPREPYDAPNWLPTARPVALGELLPLRELTVSGYEPSPITIGLRLPPDLSDWRTHDVPLDLWYRHSAVDADHGTLGVLVNQQSVKHIELAANDETVRHMFANDGSAVNRTVQLPLSMLESQAGLQFQFKYPPPVQTECRGAFVDGRRSTIDPRSTIDLSGLPHHIAMPDLAAFGTAGFPFTRMADLTDTVVVLPKSSSESEFSAFLSLLGKMGQTTGYPATGISVDRSATELQGKDILMLESGERSELLSQWTRLLPAPQRQRSSVADSESFGAWISTLSGWITQGRTGAPGSVSAPVGGAYLAGFESPLSSGRSVVVFAGADGPSLQNAVELLIFDEEQKSRLQGSLAVVRDTRIMSLSDSKSYHVGDMGLYQTASWFLSSHPLVLFLLYLLGAVLIAIMLYLSLSARAQRRLRAGRSEPQ